MAQNRSDSRSCTSHSSSYKSEDNLERKQQISWLKDETGPQPCHSHISVFQRIVYHYMEEEDEEEFMFKSFHFISGVIVPTEFREDLLDNKILLKCVFIIKFSSIGFLLQF